MQIHRSVATQQAKTIAEWADTWDRAARMDGIEGAEDAAMLLRRAARQIRVALGDEPPEPIPEQPALEPAADEFREG